MTAPTVKGRTRFITLADLDGRTRAARNARDISAWKPFGPALSRAVVSVARYDNDGTMLSWIRPAAATML